MHALLLSLLSWSATQGSTYRHEPCPAPPLRPMHVVLVVCHHWTWLAFMVHQPVWHHRTCPTCRRSGSSSTCDTSLAHLQTSHSIDVVCSALVHNFSRNMGYPFPVIPTKSAYNYPITVIIYTYIYMTHYKLLILILSTYKYVTSSYTMSYFFIEKYF
jgi:hypothetical protein